MSVIVDSELDRRHANLVDVAANPANKYGLNHGYAIMPDPNDPYGWQAYEQERARRKILEAVARQEAEAAAVVSGTLLSTISTTAATRPSSCVSLSSLSSSLSVCSSSCEGDDDGDDEDKKRKKKDKTKKCSGSECKSKTLSFQRAGPHWCDGKKWGGKIWGLTRAPGDRKRRNWQIYFDPKIGKSEIEAICRRRCPSVRQHHHHHRHRHHRRIKTKIVTVCGHCQGLGCIQCMPGGVFVPVDYDYTGDTVGYDPCGGYGHYGAGGLPNMPPHPGYSGHPAGNMEHWRVHDDKDSEKSKNGSKDGSKNGSKKGSKDGSTSGENTIGELAGRMQTMSRNNKDFWGGKWENAADDIPKVTVADLRVLAKGYQPTDKDGKGAGDDAAKWLWGTFGPDGGGGGRSGGGGPFYGDTGPVGGGAFFGGYSGGQTSGGGGDGGAGNGGEQGDDSKTAGGEAVGSKNGSAGAKVNGSPEGRKGGNGSGSRKSSNVSAARTGSGNCPAAVEEADNGGEGPSNSSKQKGVSPVRSQSDRGNGSGQGSMTSKGKGKESMGEAALAGTSVSAGSASARAGASATASRSSPNESATAAAAIDTDERQSRFERLRQRLDDAGRLRTGSWERVSPEVQREREWQRQQAMKEEWQKMQAEAQCGGRISSKSSKNSNNDNSSSQSLLLLREEDERVIRDQLLPDVSLSSGSGHGSHGSHGSRAGENEYVSRFEDAQYPQHLKSLALRRAVSDTVSYISLGTTTSAGSQSRATVAAHTARSTSGDTGYETGHEATVPNVTSRGQAGSKANSAIIYANQFDDPGYGSLYDIPGYAGYGGYGGHAGYSDCASGGFDMSAWAGVSSSSTTLLPSSSRSGSSRGKGDKLDEKDEKRKERSKKTKKGKDKSMKEHYKEPSSKKDKKGKKDRGKDSKGRI